MMVAHTVAESENVGATAGTERMPGERKVLQTEPGAAARVSLRALPSALVPENVLSAISSLYEVETLHTSFHTVILK